MNKEITLIGKAGGFIGITIGWSCIMLTFYILRELLFCANGECNLSVKAFLVFFALLFGVMGATMQLLKEVIKE